MRSGGVISGGGGAASGAGGSLAGAGGVGAAGGAGARRKLSSSFCSCTVTFSGSCCGILMNQKAAAWRLRAREPTAIQMRCGLLAFMVLFMIAEFGDAIITSSFDDGDEGAEISLLVAANLERRDLGVPDDIAQLIGEVGEGDGLIF